MQTIRHPNAAHPILAEHERQRCEIWTRVMGYHRPVASFNTGKKGEFADRVYFREHTAANDQVCTPSAD